MVPVSRISKQYQLAVSDVDFMKKIKLSAVFNYFQEIAAIHAAQLGIGFDAILHGHNVVWALTRMRVDLERYPVWDEKVTIETWPQGPRKLEFDRDYIMRDLDGNVLMRAVSTWVILDVESRKLVKSETIARDYPPFDPTRAIDCSLGKIKPEGEGKLAYRRTIGSSEIDMNGHLNNAKYIDFVMDCFSMDTLRKYQARSIQVNYVSEVLPGETIALYTYTSGLESGVVSVIGVNEEKDREVLRVQIEVQETMPDPS